MHGRRVCCGARWHARIESDTSSVHSLRRMIYVHVFSSRAAARARGRKSDRLNAGHIAASYQAPDTGAGKKGIRCLFIDSAIWFCMCSTRSIFIDTF